MAEYLQWRGAAWHFRIGVPSALRHVVGRREITFSLGPLSRKQARTEALRLASDALAFFQTISPQMDEQTLKHSLQIARLRNQLHEAKEEAQNRLFNEIKQERDKRKLEAEKAELEHERNGLKGQVHAKQEVIDHLRAVMVKPVAIPTAPAAKPTLKLQKLVDEWLAERGEEAKSKATGPGKERKGQPEYRADQRIMSLFLHTIGDINAVDLKRSKILEYLDLVAKLPVSSGDSAPFRACKSVHDFIEANKRLSDPKPTIRHSSMETTHIARLRSFLAWCHSKYVDDGFPSTLKGVTSDYKYKGANKGGDRGNRPFKPAELQKLFEGKFMAELAGDPANHERYWLLHLGLFTGMRIGETFLINPQTDIVEQDGVMLMQLTEQTEKAPNVLNSIKKNDEDGSKDRDIPVHSKLIELGFLDYVERCKAAGHKTLFPTLAAAEKPEQKASKEVTECFMRAGVHDPDTKGKGAERGKLTGFHAFRGTMAHTAIAADVSHKPAHFYIMGRADPNADPTERKHYASKPPTARLKEYIEAISFPVSFIKPTT
nr:DUF6538 domain-containing protein [uncultured Pseudogulbenkiania sp.]